MLLKTSVSENNLEDKPKLASQVNLSLDQPTQSQNDQNLSSDDTFSEDCLRMYNFNNYLIQNFLFHILLTNRIRL